MIPEIEHKNTVVSYIRCRLHQATRRRTWRFKRNARLKALLPPEAPKRFSLNWSGAAAALLAMLMCRA
ncbi:MAG: hypothetical protein IKA23_07025 [Akkermansia sp.]|nr:hypothetical protein [Akkermansia sp.]MBR2313287.1 hypothetical protein [Akkermansia sp.]